MNNVQTREAKWGERMIEVKVRFWTENIAVGKGRIRPKHAWTAGVIRITNNKAHGITGEPIPFNSLMEIPSVIEKALLKQGIILHPVGKTKKYLQVAEV